MASLDKLVAAVTEDVPHLMANLANVSAVINDEYEDINWVGFYLMEGGQLVLGPFQGKVACVEIKVGRGVCGTAVLKDETLVVPNVHEFSDHIACDKESNSEIVVPMHKDGKVIGVLDIDSPKLNRFTEKEKLELEAVVRVLEDTVL